MSNISRSIDVAADPDRAFAFVSDVTNLPRFVPTTRSAEQTEPDKVHVEGEADGRTYQDDGHIYVDPKQRLMRWGSGASGYRGELKVEEAGTGSSVAISLHFHDGDHAPSQSAIEQSLATSLDRLKSELA